MLGLAAILALIGTKDDVASGEHSLQRKERSTPQVSSAQGILPEKTSIDLPFGRSPQARSDGKKKGGRDTEEGVNWLTNKLRFQNQRQLVGVKRIQAKDSHVDSDTLQTKFGVWRKHH